MRIVVTGGAGFIGSHVAEAYLALGHEVLVVDNLSTGFEGNIPNGARFARTSIRDDCVGDLLAEFRPEVVNHHAAQMDVRRSVADPIFDAEENILGSLNIIRACVDAGVRKVVYAGTGGATYGEPEHIPADENTLPNPLSQYGVSKHTVEHYLYVYRRLYGLDYTVLRYPNVYGPRQNPHGEAGVIAIFTAKLLAGETPVIFGDGSKTRDYVFVGDVVSGNVLALTRASGEVVNLGSGIETSDREVFDAVASAVGSDVEPRYEKVRPGEVSRICLDPRKAHGVLGWRPAVDFAAGVELAVQALRQDPRLRT
jgi:UDP-glucose 4-epimerase